MSNSRVPAGGSASSQVEAPQPSSVSQSNSRSSSSYSQESTKTCNDSATIASLLMDQINVEDAASMVYIQREMLSRFEKTNEMLINFNLLSTSRYEVVTKEFQKHTQLLYDMKKDLDNVFKRIRVLKQRLEKTYPDAFSACSSVYNVMSEEEGDDDDSSDEVTCVQVTKQNVDTRDMSTSMTGARVSDSTSDNGHFSSLEVSNCSINQGGSDTSVDEGDVS